MTALHEHLIKNNVDSLNSYPVDNRDHMIEGIEKHIEDVRDDISKLYRKEDAKLYPLKNSFADTSKATGIIKRQEGFNFVQLLTPGIQKHNVNNQLRLTDEIKQAIIRKDYDYASGLIEASEILLSGDPNSKLSQDLRKITEDYYSDRGYDRNRLRDEVNEFQRTINRYEFLIQAIKNKDEYVIFPEQFTELKGDERLKLAPFAGKSMMYLNSKEPARS